MTEPVRRLPLALLAATAVAAVAACTAPAGEGAGVLSAPRQRAVPTARLRTAPHPRGAAPGGPRTARSGEAS